MPRLPELPITVPTNAYKEGASYETPTYQTHRGPKKAHTPKGTIALGATREAPAP